MVKLKKIIPYILAVLLLALLIMGYLLKDNLNSFISGEMQQQTNEETRLTVEEQIRSKYNYVENRENYDFTFLEFSSTGCAYCKQMEPVLEEVRNSKRPLVNVVFMHIMKPENLPWMKYYGISAVPMQVLLDKQGKEFYRHYGFISAEELFHNFHSENSKK